VTMGSGAAGPDRPTSGYDENCGGTAWNKIEQAREVGRFARGLADVINQKVPPVARPISRGRCAPRRSPCKHGRENRHDVERGIVEPRFGKHLRPDDLKSRSTRMEWPPPLAM